MKIVQIYTVSKCPTLYLPTFVRRRCACWTNFPWSWKRNPFFCLWLGFWLQRMNKLNYLQACFTAWKLWLILITVEYNGKKGINMTGWCVVAVVYLSLEKIRTNKAFYFIIILASRQAIWFDTWFSVKLEFIYCRSGNMHEALIFANFVRRIQESRKNQYYNSATKEKCKIMNSKLREKSQNQKFAKL